LSPIEISVSKDKENPDKAILFVKQNGANVKFFHTKDTPNGLPQARQRPNLEWDYSQQEDFLYARTIEFGEKLLSMYGSELPTSAPQTEQPKYEKKTLVLDNGDDSWDAIMNSTPPHVMDDSGYPV
jgi:hypothetical protein